MVHRCGEECATSRIRRRRIPCRQRLSYRPIPSGYIEPAHRQIRRLRNTNRVEAFCPTKDDARFIAKAMERNYFVAYSIFSLEEVVKDFENVFMEGEE